MKSSTYYVLTSSDDIVFERKQPLAVESHRHRHHCLNQLVLSAKTKSTCFLKCRWKEHEKHCTSHACMLASFQKLRTTLSFKDSNPSLPNPSSSSSLWTNRMLTMKREKTRCKTTNNQPTCECILKKRRMHGGKCCYMMKIKWCCYHQEH